MFYLVLWYIIESDNYSAFNLYWININKKACILVLIYLIYNSVNELLSINKELNKMNTEILNTIVYIVLMGLMPLVSLVLTALSLRLNNGKVALFGFMLLMPSMIIALSLVHNI